VSSFRAHPADFNLPLAPSLSLTPGSNFTSITYRGQTNFQFTLYGSSNATTWSALTTNLCVSPQMTFLETNRPARFYKATSLKTPLIYQCNFAGTDNGAFALFARTNDTVSLIGYNNSLHGEFSDALPVGINNQFFGNLLAGRTGVLTFTPSRVSGSVTNGATRTATINGILKSDVGPYQNVAGHYTGNLVAASCAASLHVIVIADGTIFLFVAFGATTDGGVAAITSNSFSVATPRGAHYNGTISVSGTPSISGNFIHGCDDNTGFGNFTMTRSEKVF
jgi:hypothetical protein